MGGTRGGTGGLESPPHTMTTPTFISSNSLADPEGGQGVWTPPPPPHTHTH